VTPCIGDGSTVGSTGCISAAASCPTMRKDNRDISSFFCLDNNPFCYYGHHNGPDDGVGANVCAGELGPSQNLGQKIFCSAGMICCSTAVFSGWNGGGSYYCCPAVSQGNPCAYSSDFRSGGCTVNLNPKPSASPVVYQDDHSSVLQPSRNPIKRPSRLPTFTPTSLRTRIEGQLTLQNINLSNLTTVEKFLLQESLKDGITETVNVDSDSIVEFTLSDLVVSSSSNKFRTVVKTSLAEAHSVLVSFTLVEESVKLLNLLQNSGSDCTDQSNSIIVQSFQVLLECNNGNDFIVAFRRAITSCIAASGFPSSSFQNLLVQANSVLVKSVSVIDENPTFQPTSIPLSQNSSKKRSSRSKNDKVIIIAVIASVVGIAKMIGTVVYCLARSRRMSVGVESNGHPNRSRLEMAIINSSRYLAADNIPI
jgi:hypothetical protein